MILEFSTHGRVKKGGSRRKCYKTITNEIHFK